MKSAIQTTLWRKQGKVLLRIMRHSRWQKKGKRTESFGFVADWRSWDRGNRARFRSADSVSRVGAQPEENSAQTAFRLAIFCTMNNTNPN